MIQTACWPFSRQGVPTIVFGRSSLQTSWRYVCLMRSSVRADLQSARRNIRICNPRKRYNLYHRIAVADTPCKRNKNRSNKQNQARRGSCSSSIRKRTSSSTTPRRATKEKKSPLQLPPEGGGKGKKGRTFFEHELPLMTHELSINKNS